MARLFLLAAACCLAATAFHHHPARPASTAASSARARVGALPPLRALKRGKKGADLFLDDFEDEDDAADARAAAAAAAARGGSFAGASAGGPDDPEWAFFDTARVEVVAGDGGDGCVAMRREKGRPHGGPAGGSGGRGGSVYLVCDARLNTLAATRARVRWSAGRGQHGMGSGRRGRSAGSTHVPVPPGTLVFDAASGKLAGELKAPGDSLLVAGGGRGGRGNEAFQSDRLTTPEMAEVSGANGGGRVGDEAEAPRSSLLSGRREGRQPLAAARAQARRRRRARRPPERGQEHAARRGDQRQAQGAARGGARARRSEGEEGSSP